MFQTNSPYKLQAFETLSGFIVRLKCNILNIIYEHRRGYESLQFILTIRLKYKNMVLLVLILKIYCNCVYNYTLSSIQCIQLYTIQYPVYPLYTIQYTVYRCIRCIVYTQMQYIVVYTYSIQYTLYSEYIYIQAREYCVYNVYEYLGIRI